MKKVLISLVASASLLASNYRIVPLSSNGVALSGSNLAKSFGADAAIINPANMSFLGTRPQVHFALNYYDIRGSKFTNKLTEVNKERYYDASDANGRNHKVALPTFAFVYPVNEKHFFGAAAYTDFAAIYGWDSDYASALANNMDIRGGTLAFSYAYKPINELSLGFSLTANHTKLKFDLIKDNVKNPNYSYPVLPSEPTWTDDNGKRHPYLWAYDGKTKTDNGLRFGYKLAFTYAPSYFDEKLRFSAVYNSKYENNFKGDMEFKLAKWDMYDFITKQQISNNIDDEFLSFIDLVIKHAENPEFQPLLPKVFELSAILAGYFTLVQDLKEGNLHGKVRYKNSFGANFLYPASINLGLAYEHGKHEFMLNVGRTFWSKNKSLDLQVEIQDAPKSLEHAVFALYQACKLGDCSTINSAMATATAALGFLTPEERTKIQEYFLAVILNQSMEQKWKDTTLISLGYRYNHDEKWSFMAGFATEDSPVSRQRISFLAKDSRIFMYSLGFEYRYMPNFTISSGAMYQKYANVSVHDVDNKLLWTSGDFNKQKNFIVNLGFNYIF